MANLDLKSLSQIQGNMLNTIIALLGINDVNPGSVLDILTYAASQEDFAQYIQMSQIVRLIDLNAMTGEDLDNEAFRYGLFREEAVKTTGQITIQRAASFTKVSTTFYAGLAAPIVGNTTINVNDASDALYGTSGTLILGRGTSNEEEVTYAIAPVDNTNYWTFTVSALANNHSVEETVILKQGSDETILAGTTVVVPATATSVEIQFTIDNDTDLLAGESQVTNVDVTAVVAGSSGNISTEAISGTDAFPTPPFTGARATNPAKFTTGSDRETDDSLRDSIKDHIQSLSKGTKTAILNAIVGLVDADSAKRVVSANVVLPQDTNTPVKIYIDDGLGFEPSFSSQGFETVIPEATGGESRLQLDLFPLVKAQVETNNSEQYDLTGSLTLIYTVGIQSETITFAASDFEFPDNATAEEVVTAINNKATLIEARTSEVGTKIVISAISDTNENIQVTGGTANTALGFPTDSRATLYLYIDDVLQSKDGVTAFIDSQNSAPYNLAAIGAFPQTLTVVVDGKTANTQTVTFQAADFDNTAAATVAEVIAVINAQLAGATATSINNASEVRISSNTELSASSKINVTGGTINNAVNGLNFDTTEVAGQDNNYTLNRELGTIELNTALTANQVVTVSSLNTRGFLRAGLAENYSPNNGETLVIEVDGGGAQTVTFDATFAAGKSAADTATFINAQLDGATAETRTIGSSTYLEIRTNTYEEATGSIEITSASTANASFSFTLDTLTSNQRPHQAYQESGSTSPFAFVEKDTLVVVVDNDIVNNTFSVLMDYDGSVTTGSISTTVWRDSTFSNVFESDDILVDFYAAFTSGNNTTSVSGTVTTITNPAGSTFRYAFSALPANMANYAIGDIVEFSGMTNSENNDNFIITGISAVGNGYVEVTNADGVVEAGSTGDMTIGQRRQITAYTQSTGQITVGVAFSNTPLAGENFVVIPSTTNNLVNYMGNTKVTSLSLKATTEGSSNNTKLQITSLNSGSDGYVQVTGGDANLQLNFSTILYRGLQAYNYYTGLLAEVHKTIYGDDTDLVSYPGVSAAGIQIQVLAPTVSDQTVAVTITLKEGVSLSQVENEVKTAISNYINNLGVGEDVIIEEIRAAVIKIESVTDVVLTTPTANEAIGDSELARVKSDNITVSSST